MFKRIFLLRAIIGSGLKSRKSVHDTLRNIIPFIQKKLFLRMRDLKKILFIIHTQL